MGLVVANGLQVRYGEDVLQSQLKSTGTREQLLLTRAPS